MELITQTQLHAWLKRLMEDRVVIAPVRVAEDLTLYQPIHSVEAIDLAYSRTAVSPKEFFLPDTEAILTIERVRQMAQGGNPVWDVKLTEGKLERDQVLFAARPCDIHALTVLDALLFDEPVDTYYAQRRDRTTLVGLACEEMGPTCFCTSLGSVPDSTRGMDVMLHQVEGGYAIEVLTEKGKALMEGLNLAAYENELPAKTWPAAEYKVAPREVWTQLFNDPQWGGVADRCLNCKICAYICPTCRCFDVRDYVVAQKPGYQKIERLRCWDSCMPENYRRIAGGHNPRPTKMQRVRNRFYCKFDYYPADFGPVACVGCGRCIDLCPVNIDITEVLQQVAAKAESNGVRS